MIKDIVKDESFLSQKSVEATKDDRQAAQDLLDTIYAHREECVGMAANMIGVLKNIIVVNIHGSLELMFNPKIIEKEGEYETTEGCLSLEGERTAKRFKKITVTYENVKFKSKTIKLSGFTAQIVQHEIDHLNGVII
ncbi:MAG: peptide deformylase [Succinivibrio sp.]